MWHTEDVNNCCLPAIADIPSIVVIIADGGSNVNPEMTIPEAQFLKAAGVVIVTVAVGSTSVTNELLSLTSTPISENLMYADDYGSLGKLTELLLRPLCTGKAKMKVLCLWQSDPLQNTPDSTDFDDFLSIIFKMKGILYSTFGPK